MRNYFFTMNFWYCVLAFQVMLAVVLTVVVLIGRAIV